MVRISAWWTRRSISAMALPGLGKMVGHSLNGKLVVKTRLRLSYLRLTTWKRRSAARASYLALRHQLAVLQRSAPRLRLRRSDRLFWVLLSRLWSGWADGGSILPTRPGTC